MLKYHQLFTLDPERDLAPLRAEGQSDGGAGRQNPLPSKPKRTHCLLNAPAPALPTEAGLAPGKRWHQATARGS